MAISPPRAHNVDWEALRARLDRAAVSGGQLSPEAHSALLERRARALARPHAQPARDVRVREYLHFTLADERYAIEAAYVLQVLKLLDLTRVPGAPEQVLGVTNLRGEVVPVFDLRRLLGARSVGLSDMSRLLILGERGPELGILADGVQEIAPIHAQDVLDAQETARALAGPCLAGVTREALIVLDGRGLLEDPRLFVSDGPD